MLKFLLIFDAKRAFGTKLKVERGINFFYEKCLFYKNLHKLIPENYKKNLIMNFIIENLFMILFHRNVLMMILKMQ